MTHEEARSLLEAYADNELSVSDALRVETHLAGCDSCRAWLKDRQALSAQLRAAPLRHRMPPALQQTLTRRVWGAKLGSGRPIWTQALAAGLLVGLLGLWVGHSFPARAPEGEEWVDAHVRSTLSARSVDVQSSSHHTVKPWLSGKLPFSPPVPELNDQGDTLIGGRADYIERTQLAALRYQHGSHQVDVFVWPDSQPPALPAPGAPIEGFRVAVARIPGFNAVLVSDMSARELDAFRERWRVQAALQ